VLSIETITAWKVLPRGEHRAVGFVRHRAPTRFRAHVIKPYAIKYLKDQGRLLVALIG
jgi:hypothetical protein